MGTVREIYEAFGRGDVPAILNKLDYNVEWETQNPVAGVPWLQSRRNQLESAAQCIFAVTSTFAGLCEAKKKGERAIDG